MTDIKIFKDINSFYNDLTKIQNSIKKADTLNIDCSREINGQFSYILRDNLNNGVAAKAMYSIFDGAIPDTLSDCSLSIAENGVYEFEAYLQGYSIEKIVDDMATDRDYRYKVKNIMQIGISRTRVGSGKLVTNIHADSINDAHSKHEIQIKTRLDLVDDGETYVKAIGIALKNLFNKIDTDGIKDNLQEAKARQIESGIEGVTITLLSLDRKRNKAINFGIAYGMGAKSLSETIYGDSSPSNMAKAKNTIDTFKNSLRKLGNNTDVRV